MNKKVKKQICLGMKGEIRFISSAILWGYHRTNMTGWNNDNGVLVEYEYDIPLFVTTKQLQPYR